MCRAAEETKKQSEDMQAQWSFSNINQICKMSKNSLKIRKEDAPFRKLCKKCEKRYYFAKVCTSKQAKRIDNIDNESENTQVIKTRVSGVRVLRNKIKLLANSITSRYVQIKMTRQRG